MTNEEIIRELALSVQKMMPRSGVGVLVITPQVIVLTPDGSDPDDGGYVGFTIQGGR